MIFVRRPRRGENLLTAATLLATLSTPLLAAPSGTIPPPPTSPEQKSLLFDMQDAFTKIAKTVEPSVVNIQIERYRTIDTADLGMPPDQTPGDAPDAPNQPPAPGAPAPNKNNPNKNNPDKDSAPLDPKKPRTPPKAAPAPPPVVAPPNSQPLTPRAPRRFEATGSGVIVSPDGYILTNDHVVDGAANGVVTVTLTDGRQFKGKVFPDYRSDLAVVKIDAGAAPLPAAQFADSRLVQPGQWAIAIGSPFNLENTMTVGIISALGRHQHIPGETANSGRYYPDLLQTDAAINPGNSGGPLFNIDGKVVGINVAIESPVEASSGVGFAIPSATAQSIMKALITKGKVTRGYLGISPSDLTPALQQELQKSPSGAFVSDVNVDSPAGKGGLQASDIITYFNGEPVAGEVSLRQAIADTEPGKSIKVAYVRGGIPLVTSVTLIPAPAVPGEIPSPTDVTNLKQSKLGLSIRDITPHDRQEMSLPATTQGVTVVSVETNSPAEAASFTAGMPLVGSVIQRVGKTVVKNKKDFDQALQAIGDASSLTISVIYSAGGSLHQSAVTISR